MREAAYRLLMPGKRMYRVSTKTLFDCNIITYAKIFMNIVTSYTLTQNIHILTSTISEHPSFC